MSGPKATSPVIFVDDREGSRQLFKSMDRAGLPVELTRLDSADVFFVGRGEQGKPINVGIEHKQVNDLVSSIRTQRLQGSQLPAMRDYDVKWLLVEGDLQYNEKGVLLRRTGAQSFRALPGAMTIGELFKRLTIMHLCGGLNWEWFRARRDVLKWLEAVYRALTDVDLDEHKSHIALYQPPAFVELSQFRQTLGTVPGVGQKVSKAAEQRFKTIKRAVNASAEEWAELVTVDKHGRTRKVGTSTAKGIHETFVREK